MPKQVLMPIDEMQRLVDLATRQPQKLRDSLEEYESDVIEKVREAVQALQSVDMDSLNQMLSDLHEGSEHLVNLGLLDPDNVAELETTVGWFGLLGERISTEALEAIVEAYDEAVQALDSFEDMKDADPYPGKKDDVAAAWEEVQSAVANLADLHEQSGIDIQGA